MDSSLNCDVIEKVLQTTGLSCDDLLAKLQEYKTKQAIKTAKEQSSEASLVPEEQSVDQRCTKSGEENSVILEANNCNFSDNSNKETVKLDLSDNTNCDENCDTKSTQVISGESGNIENSEHLENSNTEFIVSTVNQVVKDTPEEKNILENRTCSNSNNISTNAIGNEMGVKEAPIRRNSNYFEDFLFCHEKCDEISDSIKEEVEDILKKLDLQDAESKVDVSIDSVTKDEDCFDSKNFRRSNDSSRCQKDDLCLEDENISNNNAEANEKTQKSPSCPSIEDHNYSNTKQNCDIQEDLPRSSIDDSSKTEEDLRNIIRMQLSSLRNMKKSTTYLPDLQKRRSIFFHNLKKKRKSCDINPARSLSSISNEINEPKDPEENEVEDGIKEVSANDEENEIDDIKEVPVNDDSLISLSDETGFVIMDVTGGVDRVAEENTEPLSEKNEERRFVAITETNKPKMRYGYTSPTKLEKSKILTIKNYTGMFSKDPGINKSVKNSEKSPFVSDSLEDFLNESSQLKISYPIPKLGAEEGIGESTKKSPFDDVVGKTSRIEQDVALPKEKPKLIKAKTLAEMRRQFEKMKLKKKIHCPLQVKKVEPMKEESEDKSKTSILKDYNTNVVSHRNSFVVYNKKKMWISTTVNNKCVAVIDSPRKINRENVGERTASLSETPKISPTQTRKLSLLSTLNQKKTCKIKYKPGPLCKKVELQNIESRDAWTTELKTLPKIYFEVVPEVSKPIDPNFVHLLPIFEDCVITEERTNFALSVLKPKNETVEPKTFNFHVHYNNNQEKLLVRKRHKPVVCKPDLSETSVDNEIDPTTDIANILEDIVRYIEVKEIEDSLIKVDDTIVKEEPQTVDTSPKTKPRKHKRKKLELELARLSCKVIDVKTETADYKECTKPYCKLGCVCKSLLCDSVFSDHCQLVECMFGCKCPPSDKTSTSKNSLSAHTVNHLEDKAKKNLAKVEREFTQTLIHTDNDVILVGARGRNRGRTTKIPKKFTDFVGNLDEIILEEPQYIVQDKQKITLKKCTVDVPKLNLDYVIPFCLYHNTYDCDCKGEVTDFPTKIPKIRIVKTKEDGHKLWHNSCARIRKVFPQYKERNKDPKYKETLRANSFKLQTEPHFRISNQSDIEDDTPEDTVLSDFRRYSETEHVKKPSKRKQCFNIREDVLLTPRAVKSPKVDAEREFALQRRKKKLKPNGQVNDNSIASTYYPIFDGEIRVNLKDNQDMLKIIGEENASLEYLRILPWTKVIESFQSRRMNIWSKEKRSSALLCNSAGYFPPKFFIDIRKVQHKSDIINWILTDNLPPDRPRELMHLILTPRKNHFMISGYCLKKVESSYKPTVQSTCVYNENVNTNNTPKCISHIASSACIKLEPNDLDDISNSDEYCNGTLASEQVTEQLQPLETRRPVEGNENAQSTEFHDSLEDATVQHKLNEKHDEYKEEHVKQLRVVPVSESAESGESKKPISVASCLKIRPTSLADLLEPKLKQMQASRTKIKQLEPSFKDLNPKQMTPISISDLLASTASFKQMQSFSVSKRSAVSPSIRLRKTISLSELLSKSLAVPVDPVAQLEKIEDNSQRRSRLKYSRVQKLNSDIGTHPKLLPKQEGADSRTISGQMQSATPSSLNKSECKTGSHISSEEAELIALLESSSPKVKKIRVITDLNVDPVKKSQPVQSISPEVLKSKNNEPSEPSVVNSNLVASTVEQHTSQTDVTASMISKPPEHSVKHAQSIAVLQSVQPSKKIKIIQNLSSSGLLESRTNTTQVKAVSVLKSPESRMKQVLASVSDLGSTKVNITQTQSTSKSEQSESEIVTEENSSLKVLESKTKQVEASVSDSRSTKVNVTQTRECSNSKLEDKIKESQPLSESKLAEPKEKEVSFVEVPQSALKPQKDSQPLSVFELTEPKEKRESLVQVPQSALEPQHPASDITTKENSTSELLEDGNNNEQSSSNVEPFGDSASFSSFEDTEANIELNDSYEVAEDELYATPLEPASVAAPQEPTPVSKTSQPEAVSTESSNDKRGETRNATCRKRNESENESVTPESSKRSKRIRLRTNQAATKVQSAPNSEKTQTRTSVRQSVKQSTNQLKVIPSRSLKCTHKDMYNKSKTLVLTNKGYSKRRLYFIDQETQVNGTLGVALPKIARTFKWKMIYLNSDFSFLSFVRANYSIKYNDLMDVVKMSNNIKSTIALRNKEFSDHYKHPLYGIWCVPDYQDRLFIGPYLPLEKDNIETLRYLQRKLIDTQIFNKMVGKKGDQKSPTWLYETLPKSYMPNNVIIDITEEDNIRVIKPNEDVYIIDDDSDAEENEQNFVVESLLCPPFVEKLSREELKTKKLNRYIMTNIPHLGYFGACQRDNKAIEVFWPDNLRGYRFPNVIFAKNSLILYLSQIFHPIPQDFKISVVIMTHLDLESNKPVDPKYFTQSEPYICGEFGIYEKDAIPSDLLERHNITSIESVLKSEERTEENDDKLVKLFGLFLMSNEELRKNPEPKDILQWASSEIYILKKLGSNYESEKADLRNIIRTNKLKIHENIQKKIPSKTIASSRRRKITDALKISETIEIADSDEEDNQTERGTVSEPVFKKICTSGKIQTGSTSPKSEGRSLLKPQFAMSGRSLLKPSDTDKQRINSMDNPSNISTDSIEKSVNDSNIILNRKNLVITKINETPQMSE